MGADQATDAARKESDSHVLYRMGTDGQRWARELLKNCQLLDQDDAEGFLTGWFANAIEAGRSAGSREAIPPYEHPTCGDRYLISERALRAVESATKLGESLSAEAIDAISALANEAGVAFARRSLRGFDEVPF